MKTIIYLRGITALLFIISAINIFVAGTNHVAAQSIEDESGPPINPGMRFIYTDFDPHRSKPVERHMYRGLVVGERTVRQAEQAEEGSGDKVNSFHCICYAPGPTSQHLFGYGVNLPGLVDEQGRPRGPRTYDEAIEHCPVHFFGNSIAEARKKKAESDTDVVGSDEYVPERQYLLFNRGLVKGAEPVTDRESPEYGKQHFSATDQGPYFAPIFFCGVIADHHPPKPETGK